MTLPLERNPSTNAQNSISMSQVNVELFFEPNTPISLNQVTVRNLFQKPDDQTTISLWDGFGKSNIGKPKNPVFTLVTQTTATVSWGASDGICNKYTVTVRDAITDAIVGPVQNFTTLPLALTANLTGLTAGTSYKVHLLASNTAITPLPTAETIADLVTLENIPATPTVAPTPTVIDQTRISVTWETVTYASSYEVFKDNVSVGIKTRPFLDIVGTYTSHYYAYKAVSTGGSSPGKSPNSITVRSLPDFPIAVSPVTITNITSNSATVNWPASASPVVINYKVVSKLTASPFTQVYDSGLISSSLRFISTSNYSPATLYDVTVQTINEAGNADTVISFTTKTAQPAAPTATATSRTSITVTWGVTTGADYYRLYKNGTSLGAQVSPYIDTEVTVYSLHSYQVSAFNVSGESVLSATTQERSWPDDPVVVTGIVLTPDMNSIAVSWTFAATTATRTVDNYKVQAIRNDVVIYDSNLLSSSTSSANATGLLGFTPYTIRIFTINRANSIYVDTSSSTLPDTRPDPLTGSISTVAGIEPGTTNVLGSSVSIGILQPGYNTPGILISASNGSFQSGTTVFTTDWVTSAYVVPDSNGYIVFQPRMNASGSETTTVTSTFTIGGGSRTFSVTTRDPNPPSGVSASGGIGMATVSWTNAGYTYIVSGGGQTKTVSGVSSVVLGDSVNTRLSGGYTMFTVQARNSQGGTSGASVAYATVTARPVITYNGLTSTSINEGTLVRFNVSATNIGTSGLPWLLSGTAATTADIESMSATSSYNNFTTITVATSGTFYTSSGWCIVECLMKADLLSEGPETLTLSVGNGEWDFANSPQTATINDTSLTPRNQSISLSSYRADRFTTITFSISGGEPGGGFTMDRIDSTDYITNQNNIFSGTLDGSGAWSANGNLTTAGNCRFRVTFATDGNVRYTPTLEVLTIETLVWQTNPVTAGNDIRITFYSMFVNQTASATIAVTGTLPAYPPVTDITYLGSYDPFWGGGTFITLYGTMTVTATFGRTNHVVTSQVLTIKKAPPNVPQGTMASAKPATDANGEYISGTIDIVWNITPNTGGPLEGWGVNIFGFGFGVAYTAANVNYARIGGLTNGTQYTVGVFPYNSDSAGPDYAAIPVTPRAPVVYSFSVNPTSGAPATVFTLVVQGPANASVSISYLAESNGSPRGNGPFATVTTNSNGMASTPGSFTSSSLVGVIITFTATYPGGITRTCTFTYT